MHIRQALGHVLRTLRCSDPIRSRARSTTPCLQASGRRHRDRDLPLPRKVQRTLLGLLGVRPPQVQHNPLLSALPHAPRSSMSRALITSISATVAALALAAAPASARPLPTAPSCPLFPADNHWNQRIDHLPVLDNSDQMLATIGFDDPVHNDFGSGTWQGAPIGIPFTTVSRSQPLVPVTFDYDDESDPGPYPIPRDAPIEGGPDSNGDRHVIVVDRDRCVLHEMYNARPQNAGENWTAGSGAIWNLNSNALRPAGWTSADAAGLPILPGLARYDEVAAGVIDHALRFTVARTRRAYIYPARHHASSRTDPNLPAMGQRLRLKTNVNISNLPAQARAIAQALKTYGMLVADNGSDMYLSGAPNAGWNNDQLRKLRTLRARDFEVVDSTLLPRPTGG
jgi:hypothetical protein